MSSALWALIWDTANSPAESIWFVFVLFVYCVCVPLLLGVFRYQLSIVFLVLLWLSQYTFVSTFLIRSSWALQKAYCTCSCLGMPRVSNYWHRFSGQQLVRPNPLKEGHI